MSNKFDTLDIPDEEYEQNGHFAVGMYKEGAEPSFSISNCGSHTAGYGREDGHGYWEFPLTVDQESYKVDVNTTVEDIE